jgi:GT2 family glycosyltransferase
MVAVTPRITVVMLAYGPEPWLDSAVAAALASTGVQVEVVVVDNGCTSDAVSALADRPGMRVHTPGVNLGYPAGCHYGAASADSPYLAFVNSDAELAPGALAALVAVAAEPGVGLAMASVRLADSPEVINTAGNPLHVAGLSWAGGYGAPAADFADRRQVPAGSGCCFVMRRAVWRAVGGLTEEYFLYHEDTELSLRLWQRGLTVEYVPGAVALHHYEFSRNPVKHYLLERNRLLMVATAYQGRTLALLAPVLLLTEAAMLATAMTGGWLRPKLRGWRWLWHHRRWVMSRRRQLQAERTVPDAGVARLMTARFDPSHVEAPTGVGAYNALVATWWRLVRPLLPGRLPGRAR